MSKCIECGSIDDLNDITLSEDNGFCKSTSHKKLCYNCYKEGNKLTDVGQFIKLKSGLYYDRYGFNTFEKVYTEGQLKYIFNQDFYDLLKCIV